MHIDPLLHITHQLTLPSPVEEVRLPWLQEYDVKLLIKREDLIHPLVSGNKWRKLKGNLRQLSQKGLKGIITYGGAFSNHLHATAAATNIAGLSSVAIVRGEYDENNPTLKFCRSQHMKLHFVTRTDYREKEGSTAIQAILKQYPDHLVVPEGGSSDAAMLGLAELARELDQISDIDLITVSAGTGMTAAGIIQYQDVPVRVYSALKTDYLNKHIANLSGSDSFSYIADYHFGGYARTTETLLEFINEFFQDTSVPLDPVYNGKALYGIFKDVQSGAITEGSAILHIHTGGLQGVTSYNYVAKKSGKQTLQKKINTF